MKGGLKAKEWQRALLAILLIWRTSAWWLATGGEKETRVGDNVVI